MPTIIAVHCKPCWCVLVWPFCVGLLFFRRFSLSVTAITSGPRNLRPVGNGQIATASPHRNGVQEFRVGTFLRLVLIQLHYHSFSSEAYVDFKNVRQIFVPKRGLALVCILNALDCVLPDFQHFTAPNNDELKIVPRRPLESVSWKPSDGKRLLEASSSSNRLEASRGSLSSNFQSKQKTFHFLVKENNSWFFIFKKAKRRGKKRTPFTFEERAIVLWPHVESLKQAVIIAHFRTPKCRTVKCRTATNGEKRSLQLCAPDRQLWNFVKLGS